MNKLLLTNKLKRLDIFLIEKLLKCEIYKLISMLKQFLKIQNYLMVLRSGKNHKTLNVVFELSHENKMLKTNSKCWSQAYFVTFIKFSPDLIFSKYLALNYCLAQAELTTVKG